MDLRCVRVFESTPVYRGDPARIAHKKKIRAGGTQRNVPKNQITCDKDERFVR